jgi:Mg2+ and Co2+ transporter CorA
LLHRTIQLSLRLDTSRNELLIANTWLAILACVFGLGAFVSGIFGMNLDNTGKLQQTKNVFNTVIAATTGVMIIMFCGMYYMFQRSGMFPAKISLATRDAVRLKI